MPQNIVENYLSDGWDMIEVRTATITRKYMMP